jgi:hypothetical protein
MHSLAISKDGRIYAAWLDERNVHAPMPSTKGEGHHMESNRDPLSRDVDRRRPYFLLRIAKSLPKRARVARRRSLFLLTERYTPAGVRSCPEIIVTSRSRVRPMVERSFQHP